VHAGAAGQSGGLTDGGLGSGPRPDPWRRRRAAELRARGLTLAEIGRRLGLSRQLVHYYVRLAGGPRHGRANKGPRWRTGRATQ
jgi:hypothetical protein